MTTKLDILKVVNYYIQEFKKLPDSISGKRFRIGKTTPRGWYEAISTTGFCVKVSEKFLEYLKEQSKELFDKASLLSISIHPNKYGRCGDGSHNAWHTCLDLGNGYIVDLTIAQFGYKYNNRHIWKKVDWLNEFQDPNDTHDIGWLPQHDKNELVSYESKLR